VTTTSEAPDGGLTADDFEVAFTPSGGYGEDMPAPILSGCTEPLPSHAIDMRGTWSIVSVEVNEADVPDHGMLGARQRIEQCGDRVVITSGGVVHDMRANGRLKDGVHDVAAADFTTEVHVVAAFEDGVHVLRPDGLPIEVRRWIEGEQLVWSYAGAFTARLDRTLPR